MTLYSGGSINWESPVHWEPEKYTFTEHHIYRYYWSFVKKDLNLLMTVKLILLLFVKRGAFHVKSTWKSTKTADSTQISHLGRGKANQVLSMKTTAFHMTQAGMCVTSWLKWQQTHNTSIWCKHSKNSSRPYISHLSNCPILNSMMIRPSIRSKYFMSWIWTHNLIIRV